MTPAQERPGLAVARGALLLYGRTLLPEPPCGCGYTALPLSWRGRSAPRHREEREMTDFRSEDRRWTVTGWQMNENGYSVVTEEAFAAYTGPSEFYSGLRPGNMVTVSRESVFCADGTHVRDYYAARRGGAWLSTEPDHLDFTLAAYDPESHEPQRTF